MGTQRIPPFHSSHEHEQRASHHIDVSRVKNLVAYATCGTNT